MKKLIVLSISIIPNSVLDLHPSMDMLFIILFAAIYIAGFIGLFVLFFGEVGALIGLFAAVALFGGGGDIPSYDEDQRNGYL